MMPLTLEMMALLDGFVAHLAGQKSVRTMLLYKIIAFYWCDQQQQPVAEGLSWSVLPDGRRQCLVKGTPCYDHDTGKPLTLEELGA